MNVSELELWIFRTPIRPEDSARFEAVYEFWHRLWCDVFKEIGNQHVPESDDLTRQNEILVLFKGERPIAMVCHRIVDFSSAAVYRDSYFSVAWTEREMSLLRERGGYGIIGSQILVDPEFRKTNSGLRIKQLISFVSLQFVQRPEVEVVIGTMRVDKGMDRVFYEAGAEPLATRRPYYGAQVDLVCFRPRLRPIAVPAEFVGPVQLLLSTARYSEPIIFETRKTKGRIA